MAEDTQTIREEEGRATVIEHLKELRKRIIYSAASVIIGLVVGMVAANWVLRLLQLPAPPNIEFIAIEMTENITVWFNIGLTTGVILAMPFLIYQVFAFIGPGLTKREKHFVLSIIPAITIMFLLGVAFAYFVALPLMLEFFYNFQREFAPLTPRISDYVNIVSRVLLFVGLVFETPLAIMGLAKLGLVSPKWLASRRRWWILLSFILAGCGGRPHSAVIVAGSTSVQPYAEVLAEEYWKQYPDNHVDIQGGGSSSGITAAETGVADIGMSSRALTEKEMHLWNIEIAKDGLAIIIHPDNPVQNLTMDAVRNVYAGKFTNWAEVGGRDAKIHIIAREEGSGTRSAFDDLVMDGRFVDAKAIIQDSNGSVRQLVSGDPNSIGFISLGLVDDSVKALWLDGIAPKWENVVDGSYSLYRPFLFVTATPPQGDTQHFIDFVTSPQGQQMLIDEGLIPMGMGMTEGANR
ncbi:MAG: twin-arginine translocase subunit TatC [Dehalococcoidia bacterium]|nr:twin-arginine translocase subunit TatC [Dehalococcoidia bacterium]